MSQTNQAELLAACEAVLMFYRAASWTDDARKRWEELTGSAEATTRVLAGFVGRVFEANGGVLNEFTGG